MTLDEQARAHIRKYQARLDFEGWSDDLCVEIVADAIRAQWEDAAKEIERVRAVAYDADNNQRPSLTVLSDLIRWCRQRAKGEPQKADKFKGMSPCGHIDCDGDHL